MKLLVKILILVLLVALPANGGLIFSDGEVHNIDYYVPGDVWVDYGSPILITTVNILDGAYIGGFVWFWNSSSGTMSGGTISTWPVFIRDSANFTLTGGSIANNLECAGNSVFVAGGNIGGNLNFVSGHMELAGGTIDGSIIASSSNSLVISGYDFAVALNNPPNLESMRDNYYYSHIDTVADVWYDQQLALWNSDDFFAMADIDGQGFQLEGILTGTLADGSFLDNPFVSSNGSILLNELPPPPIPEPRAVVLGGIGLLAVGWLRRRTSLLA